MTEALERALAPLLTFGSFFGLGMFEYPRGQPRAYLSCLYVLAKWGSLMYFYYYPYLKRILHVEKAFDIQIINLVLINTLILISLCRFKAHPLTTVSYITQTKRNIQSTNVTTNDMINETVAILQKLSNYNLDENLRKQILQFILQIKQTKVEFGLGQYYFGYNFICEMYSTVLSATIILTQFNWHLNSERAPKS
ncbi:PREDICTED: uncharacterized protein LOC105149720 [Acromyrmex echinatior]|uniref:uncharacterized protein LOC105149720 n=1 Tax=Acromyrmex echinatior TaxID=103372 RepID=UPI0005810890|nr:PREDICTED: uncharacterized protein LOC105149720 [Acromyrmex echinatior]